MLSGAACRKVGVDTYVSNVLRFLFVFYVLGFQRIAFQRIRVSLPARIASASWFGLSTYWSRIDSQVQRIGTYWSEDDWSRSDRKVQRIGTYWSESEVLHWLLRIDSNVRRIWTFCLER